MQYVTELSVSRQELNKSTHSSIKDSWKAAVMAVGSSLSVHSDGDSGQQTPLNYHSLETDTPPAYKSYPHGQPINQKTLSKQNTQRAKGSSGKVKLLLEEPYQRPDNFVCFFFLTLNGKRDEENC